MINVKGIKKNYGELEVLKGIDLDVKQGEVVVIIGPSGSGKSTFLRCLNYLEIPTEGLIKIDDFSIDAKKHSKDDIKKLRSKSAMVFQNFNLFNNKTVLENVINKDYDGTYLESFVTVAETQDEFTINLNGISSDSEVFMIDPNYGEMRPMSYENGVFTIKTNIDKDVTYGFIIDYKLSGSIRVVDDINSIDEDRLFNEILISLGCGL